MGSLSNSGCGEIWCPGRVSQGEQETSYIYLSYMALLSDIIDAEPSSFEDVEGKQVWKDAIHEEYQPILENDVRDVDRKSVV